MDGPLYLMLCVMRPSKIFWAWGSGAPRIHNPALIPRRCTDVTLSVDSGAVGCSLLAYILPCMLDLKLRGRDLPILLIIKDSAIIAFAVFASVSGLVIIMMTVISGRRPT